MDKIDWCALISYNIFVVLNAFKAIKYYNEWSSHIKMGAINHNLATEQIGYALTFGLITTALLLIEIYLYIRIGSDMGGAVPCQE